MKVYVVTSGEYSDYHVDGVFLSEDKAVAFCANNNHACLDESWLDPFNIEEYETMDENIESTNEDIVYRYFVCGMHLKRAYCDEPVIIYDRDIEQDMEKNKRRDTDGGRREFPRSQQYVYLNRPDRETAIKIVQDRYAQWKAERAGI